MTARWHWSEGTRVRDLVSTPQLPVRAAEPVVRAEFQAHIDHINIDLLKRARHAAIDAGYPVEAVNAACSVMVGWSRR